MGTLTRACVLLVAVAVAFATRCNIGSVTTDSSGSVIRSYVHAEECTGVCTKRSAVIPGEHTLHFLACEDKNKAAYTVDDACSEDQCNVVAGMEVEEVETMLVLPQVSFTCYVGLQIGNVSVAGGVEPCSGACASITTPVAAYNATAFFCTPHALCDAIVKPPSQGPLQCGPFDNVTACCCYSASNCNIGNIPVPTPLPTLAPLRRPIACYSGIHIAGQLISGGHYVACQGDCASLTYKYKGTYDLTMYSCDPAAVCQGLSLQNDCTSIANNTFAGCCCNTDACIDPTQTPPVFPNGTRPAITECYVGVHVQNLTGNGQPFDVGSPIYCDGMCGRAKSVLNGYEVEAFFCAQYSLCYALDAVDTCSSVPVGPGLTACCCSNGANCNTNGTDITPVPPTRVRPNEIIACLEGLHINNQSISERWTACDGECAMLSYETAVGGSPYKLSLLTCDPATVCRGLGIQNRCTHINNTAISGCCCDTDACIDPRRGRYPNGAKSLKCMTGVRIGESARAITIGGSLECDGECASVETTVNGTFVAGYFCAPRTLCETIGIHNDCMAILGDPGSSHATGCCCDGRDNCNANRHHFTPLNVSAPTGSPITCFSGLAINNNFFNNSDRYVACKGDCGLINFATSVGGTAYNTTMYSCDPVEVCKTFNMTNTCGSIGPLSGCCCQWNDCLDLPNRQVKPAPVSPNQQCFVGLTFSSSSGITTYGGSMPCDGECASIQTKMNGVLTFGYFCAPNTLCNAFDLWNNCNTHFLDKQDWLETCCCTHGDNCNILDKNNTLPTAAPPVVRRTPLACYSGLALNKKNITANDRYMSCTGDCAQLTFASTWNGMEFDATIFTCDPVNLCQSLGMSNNCTNITSSGSGSSISGCCCDWNDCIDKTTLTIKERPHKDDLQCFVGMQLRKNPMDTKNVTLTGATLPCNGDCVSVQTHINGYDTWGFFCAPQALCDAFDPERVCGVMNMDQTGDYLETCCCGRSDNCNLKLHNIPVPANSSVPANTKPLACYSGIALNGKVLSADNRYMACVGDCAQITYSSTIFNIPFNATMFTCDPVTLCKTLQMKDSCTTIGNGANSSTAISGCCCGWSDCIDRNSLTVKSYAKQCFVGMSFSSGNGITTYGGPMACDGECASLQTKMNGVQTFGYFCAPYSLCEAFDPSQNCSTHFLDSQDWLTTCCCTHADNCNIIDKNIPLPTAAPPVVRQSPLSCYSGLAFNRKNITANDRYMSCFGDCAQITFASVWNGLPFDATIFTCDPVNLCQSLGMSNKCTNIASGSSNSSISGCCCDWNDCIDKTSLTVKDPPHKDDLQCFVGMQMRKNPMATTNVTLTGATLPCNGDCVSIQTHMNGYDTWGFFCAPQALCDVFDPERVCGVMNMDTTGDYLETCCCAGSNNCNLKKHNIPVPSNSSVPANNTTPLACYSGIALNGKVLSADNRYMACAGDCAQISYSSSLGGTQFMATMFTCDPVSLCSSLGMSNNCATIPNGNSSTSINGCCCNWNDCIDKTTLTVKTTPTPPTTGSAAVASSLLACALSLVLALQ